MKKVILSEMAEITPRFSEVDSLGIVWHGNYLKYFEDGREAFGAKYNLGYLEVFNQGFLTPLVKINCDFKKILKYGDKAIIKATYIDCEAAKITFKYLILRIVLPKQSIMTFLVYCNGFKLLTFFFNWSENFTLSLTSK